jgi:hypothetical protein
MTAGGHHHHRHGSACGCDDGGHEHAGGFEGEAGALWARHEHRGQGGFRRRFTSRGERIAELEAYLSDLQAEAKAVKERLAALKAA